jgi:hypothetical protein
MELLFIFSIGLSISFLSGFLLARFLYIRSFNKKVSLNKKIISELQKKYFSIFNRNNNLEARVKQLQPNLISLETLLEKIIVSMN